MVVGVGEVEGRGRVEVRVSLGVDMVGEVGGWWGCGCGCC